MYVYSKEFFIIIHPDLNSKKIIEGRLRTSDSRGRSGTGYEISIIPLAFKGKRG